MTEDDMNGAARAHRNLLSRLEARAGESLNDTHIAKASRLPGWTVGHVLAHLTHNAISLEHLFREAEAGRVGRQYPGGPKERSANIERDAGLRAAEHIERLRAAHEGLEGTWSRARRAWSGRAETASGAVVPITDLPLRRWREVEIHTGDLGLSELGCDGPRSWSPEYVRRDVRVLTMQWSARGSMGLNTLPPAVAGLDDRSRLAWLTGRLHVDGVGVADLL